jgi:hypothetical protein
MKIEVNINKTYFMIILGVMFLLAGGLVYAYGGSSPSVVGHSANEIELPSNVCRSDGTGCPSTSSQSLSCTIRTCTGRDQDDCTVTCPSGYTMVGGEKRSSGGEAYFSGNSFVCKSISGTCYGRCCRIS